MNKLSYFSRPSKQDLASSQQLNSLWHQVTKLRYEVFAEELQQYSTNGDKMLEDPGEHFLTLSDKNNLIGYVSINSPSDRKYRMENYFGKQVMDKITEKVNTTAVIHEVRGLTIKNQFRNQGFAKLLMMGALKFSNQNGANNIIAMGHTEVLPLYRAIGMHVFDEYNVTAGDVMFYPMISEVDELISHAGTEFVDF